MLTTLPDSATAEALANAVLNARLAACVTEQGTVRSRYRWQGVMEQTEEIALLFKTSAQRAEALERFIFSHHPYEVPEIVSWTAQATDAYSQWVEAETTAVIHV